MLKTNVRKYDNFKMYYWHGATLVGKYKMPQLKPTQSIPHDVIGYNERSGIKNPEKHWIDFFIDDALFESFWNHPEMSFNNLKRFEGIITTDYSMYPELLPAQNIWNCTRNRVMAYYLQNNGFDAIPVATWCMEEDFEWCFDGLPEMSSIAISSNGCLSSKIADRTRKSSFSKRKIKLCHPERKRRIFVTKVSRRQRFLALLGMTLSNLFCRLL